MSSLALTSDPMTRLKDLAWLPTFANADFTALCEELDNHTRELFEKRENHFGYPNLFGLDKLVPAPIKQRLDLIEAMLQINIGTPDNNPYPAPNAHEFEVKVRHHFEKLLQFDGEISYGGIYTGSSEAVAVGVNACVADFRDRFPDKKIVFLYTENSHYCVPKAGLVQNLTCLCVEPELDVEGAISAGPQADLVPDMDLESVKAIARANKDACFIVPVTHGTTVQQFADKPVLLNAALLDVGVTQDRISIVMDAAFAGGYLPFADCPPHIKPTFKDRIYVKAITTSSHKACGLERVAAVLVSRLPPRSFGAKGNISYLGGSEDASLSGCKNGQFAVRWYVFLELFADTGVYKACAELGCENAVFFQHTLSAFGDGNFLNYKAITIFYDKPSQEIIKKFQLSPQGGQCHAMPVASVKPLKLVELLIEHYHDQRECFGDPMVSVEEFAGACLIWIKAQFKFSQMNVSLENGVLFCPAPAQEIVDQFEFDVITLQQQKLIKVELDPGMGLIHMLEVTGKFIEAQLGWWRVYGLPLLKAQICFANPGGEFTQRDSNHLFDREGKTLVVGMPYAYSPTCHSKHLPDIKAKLNDLEDKFDRIVVATRSDQYALGAWTEQHGLRKEIFLVADTKRSLAHLLHVPLPENTDDYARYFAIVSDGKIRKLQIEADISKDVDTGVNAILTAENALSI